MAEYSIEKTTKITLELNPDEVALTWAAIDSYYDQLDEIWETFRQLYKETR